MICCAVIDTNVLVSALLSSKDNTATVQLVRKVIGGEIIPVYSNVITKECRKSYPVRNQNIFTLFGILFCSDSHT